MNSRAEIINWLKDLVEINSIYPNEKELCDFVFAKFTELGYKVAKQEISESRYNIIISRQNFNKESRVALYAHLDTVKNVEGWSKDPFQLTIEADKAYGLGSYDMKGGMVANILAFLDPSLQDTQLHLIFCVDEENISTGAHSLVNSGFLNEIECVVSPEPAFKYDQNGITIGRVGHPIYNVQLKRPSAHFMFYKPEIDLNLLAAKFINRLTDLYLNLEDRRQFVYVNKFNTINHGMSVPESVEIELEVSLLPPLTADQLLQQFKKIMQEEQLRGNFSDEISIDISYKNRPTPFLEPYEVDSKNKYLKLLGQSVDKITGNPAKPYFRSSVGDDNVFAKAGLTVLGIGPSGAGAHAPDEWVSLESIERLRQIMVEFVSITAQN